MIKNKCPKGTWWLVQIAANPALIKNKSCETKGYI